MRTFEHFTNKTSGVRLHVDTYYDETKYIVSTREERKKKKKRARGRVLEAKP